MVVRMGALRGWSWQAKCCVLLCFFSIIHTPNAVNVGLVSGNMKRFLAPLVLKNYVHHSPVHININRRALAPLASTLPPVKIPSITPPVTIPPKLQLGTTMPKLNRPAVLRSLPKPRLDRFERKARAASPLINALDLHKLPFLPLSLFLYQMSPVVPRMPKFPQQLLPGPPPTPMKIPVIHENMIYKSKQDQLRTLKDMKDSKEHILKKLNDLRKRGSLTSAEYYRFRRMFLKSQP